MSRNGSGVYSLPPGSTAVDDAIIDPVVFNTLISDLESDANTARPIVAGGTGATTAAAARTNLGVAYSQSLSTNGYYISPGGLIMQWGMIITGNDVSGAAKLTVTGTLPITFPTAGFHILGTLQDAGTGGAAITSSGFLSSSTYEFLVEEFKSVTQSIRVRFIAIGH